MEQDFGRQGSKPVFKQSKGWEFGRIPKPVLKTRSEWLRDLTRENVESNPGPKTAAQKKKQKEKKLMKKQGIAKNKSQTPKRRKKAKSASKRVTRNVAREGRMNAAYRKARSGAGMRSVTDGISIMKTIHNASVIEDTFSVRREKVSDIIGTTATTLNVNLALYINPGNSVLFPIFSQIAATYEQFRVNECIFSYETEAYAASGTAVSAGKVILATNYDPADSQFSTATQMENYFNSDRGAPYCEIVHDVLLGDHALKDEPLKTYFVNSSANLIAPTSDTTNNKFYDLGLFQLACQGNASATAEIGELYVTYSFTMIRPKQQTPTGQNLPSSHYTGAVQTTANAFVGTTKQAGSNLNLTVASNVITFSTPGRFFVVYTATATTSTIAPPTYGAGVTQAILAGRYSAAGGVFSGQGTADITMSFFVDVNSTVAATLTWSAVIVGGLLWDLVVSQVPGALALKLSPVDLLEQRYAALAAKWASIERRLDHSMLTCTEWPSEDEEEKSVVKSPDKTLVMDSLHRRVSNRFFPNPLVPAVPPPAVLLRGDKVRVVKDVDL